VNYADWLNQKERYEEAEKALRRAIQMLPENSYAYTVLGRSLIGQQNYDGAVGAFQTAIRFDPNDQRPKEGLETARRLQQQADAPQAP